MPRKQPVVRRKSAAVLDAVTGTLTTKSVEAEIKPVEDTENPNGEFVLILSKDNLDRDVENLWADEWMHPLPPKIHMDTDHAFSKGLSVPHTAGSGVPSIDEDGNLVVKGSYAGTPHGQLTRQLVKEGHIWQASVAYQTHVLNDGHVVRELLNGTFTGVPANPEAVVLSSKSSKASTGVATRYADPGYQSDSQPRYPIDTADDVHAAQSGVQKNSDKYSTEQRAAIQGRINSRARALGIGKNNGKTLMLAMLKAITDNNGQKDALTGDATTLLNKIPDRVLDDDEVGARSVYDGDTDNNWDAGDEFELGDDLFQAVHDAAVALGAACDHDDMKSIKQFMTSLKDAATSTNGGGGTLQNFVTTPVSRGWDFVVAGPPGSQMYTLSQGEEVMGHGKLEDVANAKSFTVKSNTDGEDSSDESDSDEDTSDEEKSDSPDTKSYEVTLADGSTVVLDASVVKEVADVETKRAVGEGETIPNIAEKKDAYDPSDPDDNPELKKPAEDVANANTEPPENSAGTEEAANAVDAQSIAASGARTDEVDTTLAADDGAEKSVTTDDVKPSPGVLAAKARMRKFMLDAALNAVTDPDDNPDGTTDDTE